jgi:hypothetical protein
MLAATGGAVAIQTGQEQSQQFVREAVFSTLFNVVAMPTYVYGAPCRNAKFSCLGEDWLQSHPQKKPDVQL